MGQLRELIAELQALESLDLFFVGGQGKSGTTWVEHLLDAHPRIRCRGEGHLSDILLPAVGEALDAHRHYLDQNNRRFPELEPYPAADTHTRQRLELAVLALHLRQVQGDGELRALGERTPANADRIGALSELLPDAHFIHVVRDPRDAAISMWHHLGRLDPTRSAQRYKDIESFVVALTDRWRQAFTEIRTTGRRSFGERYHELRYEDLHADPVVALAEVVAALGAAADAGTLQACAETAGFHRLSGGRDAGQEDRASHFRKGVVGDWRGQISEECNRRALEAGGALMEELGYR